MSLVKFPVETTGSEQEFKRPRTEKGFTGGELDWDSVRIRASALRVNLSEEEAIELVDKIRKELPINK